MESTRLYREVPIFILLFVPFGFYRFPDWALFVGSWKVPEIMSRGFTPLDDIGIVAFGAIVKHRESVDCFECKRHVVKGKHSLSPENSPCHHGNVFPEEEARIFTLVREIADGTATPRTWPATTDAKLKPLGRGGYKKRPPLAAPGQPRNFASEASLQANEAQSCISKAPLKFDSLCKAEREINKVTR
uniref:Uncharacterized protein n=1 Tax=Candidatus Kentrum sp. FW TaxID=2126338 RepID=A0A450U2V5_9GAMM|nr:MAG: hypothetical protein BECKFW1821C_GA0114237_11252 [Candidatus Kentron sp. FW]